MRSMALGTILTWSVAAYAGDIEGSPRPVDGNSFSMEIRIFGIDAPDRGQTCKDADGRGYGCGQVAADAMATLLKDKTVVCDKKDQDTKYGRPVAVCRVDGVDIGAIMVDRGLAVADGKYSQEYVPNEERAKAAKRGLWSGTFEMPWDYRERTAQHPLPLATNCPPPPVSSGCMIKGNIISNKKGPQRIYHLPGSQGYASIKIEPSKGERYFCSEEEATACGWRPRR